MIVTIHQPQYLPWFGYFDKADRADVFILLDDVQFKKNDWQNRNRIRTSNGEAWLSIPIVKESKQAICHTNINNKTDWKSNHLKTLVMNYTKAPYFKDYITYFEDIFSKEWISLSKLNITLFKQIVTWLGITTQIVKSSDYQVSTDQTMRLVELCQEFKSNTYLAGADGETYMDINRFKENNITIETQNYEHPIYTQLWTQGNSDNFISHMSIIDLLFNHGPDSLNILRGSK
ncbi:MAG: hypothetical protein ACI9F2_000494 [Lysobacterales bacterium]